MLKWRLLLTTIPLALAIVALTYLRQEWLRLPALLEFSEMGATLTGTTLIIGFMLAGVIADYKESERLPGELASSLEAYADIMEAMAHADHPLDIPTLRQSHLKVVSTVESWVINDGPVEPCFTAIQGLNAVTAQLEVGKGMNAHISRALAETQNVRRLISRIDTIRRTSFIQSGYALLQVMVVVVLTLLLFTSFKNAASQYIVVAFLALLYLYLIRLISDLDNPFGYSGKQGAGTAEVSPEPLSAYRRRLER